MRSIFAEMQQVRKVSSVFPSSCRLRIAFSNHVYLSSLNQHCDYSPYKPPPAANDGPEPLITRHEACSFADLSSRGMNELLEKISACSDPFVPIDLSTVKLSHLVQVILESAKFDLLHAIMEFEMNTHQWCPILDEELFHDHPSDISRSIEQYPLFMLCVWFLTQRLCQQQGSLAKTTLYRAMKQIFSLLQIHDRVKKETAQVGMLIAVYEVSHGLQTQAGLTISVCATMLHILRLDPSQRTVEKESNGIERLCSSLLRLDR